mmetsp:Transcript_16732/g.20454  ORF Transcript_16732/g.20454 Transcript_16732/m.20454 type:complete len:153 (-) Transcript_16732:62-520(-)
MSVSMTQLPPLNDINILFVTDVHSWVFGHGYHEPLLNADYGDVLSFVTHLRRYCHDRSKELFFVMNGDFTDGTGLSSDPPVSLAPILSQMPFDAINIGNHELYDRNTIRYLLDRNTTSPNHFVAGWDGHYLTSNVLDSSTGEPLRDSGGDSQ